MNKLHFEWKGCQCGIITYHAKTPRLVVKEAQRWKRAGVSSGGMDYKRWLWAVMTKMLPIHKPVDYEPAWTLGCTETHVRPMVTWGEDPWWFRGYHQRHLKTAVMWWKWQERRRDTASPEACAQVSLYVWGHMVAAGSTAGAREGPENCFAWEENKEKGASSGMNEDLEAEVHFQGLQVKTKSRREGGTKYYSSHELLWQRNSLMAEQRGQAIAWDLCADGMTHHRTLSSDRETAPP